MRSSNTLNLEAQSVVLADVAGAAVDASQVVSASAQFVISGTGQSAPAGNFIIQWSDDPPTAAAPSNWSTLSTVAVSAAGMVSLAKVDVCAQWLRLLYDNTVSIAAASLVNQGLTYTAVTSGASGNNITIALINPGLPSQSLSISVVGNAISVNLATNGASAITSTASLIKAALEASAAASALVSVAGSGAIAVTALAATPLAGGRDGGAIVSGRLKTFGF